MGSSTAPIENVPTELIEIILFDVPTCAIAAFSQTCRAFYNLVYYAKDHCLWRTTFLREYDDPRLIRGEDTPIQWDKLLRRWTGAINKLRKTRPEPNIEVLKTLIEMIDKAAPIPFPSRNLAIVDHLLHKSGILNEDNGFYDDDDTDYISEEYNQLIYRLKVYRGWNAIVHSPEERLKARCFVYNLRHYHERNDFGPFLPDGSYRVNWQHLFMIQEVIAMNITDFMEEMQSGLPMSMKYIQPPQPNSLPVTDWAGVTGSWQVVFCFCDHTDLLSFNRLNVYESSPDIAVFEDETFEEALRILQFELRLADINDRHSNDSPPISASPDYPTLYFVGNIAGDPRVRGWVYMTENGYVRWSFTSGDPGQTIWSTEAIQIGPPGSSFGALGTWTTIFHDLDDPVGPMWLWKIPDQQKDR